MRCGLAWGAVVSCDVSKGSRCVTAWREGDLGGGMWLSSAKTQRWQVALSVLPVQSCCGVRVGRCVYDHDTVTQLSVQLNSVLIIPAKNTTPKQEVKYC